MKFCENSYGNPEDMDKNNNNYAKISEKKQEQSCQISEKSLKQKLSINGRVL